MNQAWLIVLGPKGRLPESGDLDLIHPVSRERIAEALDACRDALGPFEVPDEGARVVPLAEGVLPLELARTAAALADAIGPVTIVDQDFTLRVEVDAGTPPDMIVVHLADASKALEEKTEQARTLPPRASLEPPAFAPGRPEKRLLPPLRTALIAGAVLVFAWYQVKDRFSGCDKPAGRAPENPQLADTESAFMLAHMMMTSGSKRETTPEGWIEVGGEASYANYLVVQTKDGKRYICDGWKKPIRCTRTRQGLRYSSCGPNGRDEQGHGDDVVRIFPASTDR